MLLLDVQLLSQMGWLFLRLDLQKGWKEMQYSGSTVSGYPFWLVFTASVSLYVGSFLFSGLNSCPFFGVWEPVAFGVWEPVAVLFR